MQILLLNHIHLVQSFIINKVIKSSSIQIKKKVQSNFLLFFNVMLCLRIRKSDIRQLKYNKFKINSKRIAKGILEKTKMIIRLK